MKKNISFVSSFEINDLLRQGLINHQNGNLDKAAKIYQKILKINPDNYDCLQLTGTILLQKKKYDKAINYFKNAQVINSNDPRLYNNLGITYKELGEFNEALINYEKAIYLKSDYIEAIYNHGIILKDLRQIDKALSCFNKVLQLKPDHKEGCWNKSHLKLLSGEYKEGWKLYEIRNVKEELKHNYPKFHAPLWLGDASIEGKTLLVHSEQGLGDTLQFCRYLPMLQSFKPKEIIFYVEKSLISILSSMDNEITLIEKNHPLPSFDFYCPLLSLPLAFKTTLETIPANIPYLKVDDVKNKYWQDRLGQQTKPRIGLVWSGSTAFKNDHNRSLKLQQLSSLLELPFEFHSLQKDIRDGDKKTLQAYKNLYQHQQDLHDFSDTAALMNQMDLIISSCTSVAHLAGALGKQVWVMLQFLPDFRWLLDRHDSPWYPSAKLFRQAQIGDWESVIRQLISELKTINLKI